MNVYLNRIDGIDDAIISLFLSKRTLTRDRELKIREEVRRCSAYDFSGGALGRLTDVTPQLGDWLVTLLKWGTQHITMLRFVDLSFSVHGIHRAGQDDLDSHAMRMQNRIIRSSTRLADFSQGEMSEYYAGKILPTDVALAALGIDTPKEIEYKGRTYVRAVNGYIAKGMEDSKDVKRGLYMLSIPSNFIFRIDLTDFAHVFKERNENGTAHPEVKAAVEDMTNQVEAATLGFVTREILTAIKN